MGGSCPPPATPLAPPMDCSGGTDKLADRRASHYRSPASSELARVRDDSCCRVEDTLQLVSRLLRSANQETAAIVDSACDEHKQSATLY